MAAAARLCRGRSPPYFFLVLLTPAAKSGGDFGGAGMLGCCRAQSCPDLKSLSLIFCSFWECGVFCDPPFNTSVAEHAQELTSPRRIASRTRAVVASRSSLLLLGHHRIDCRDRIRVAGGATRGNQRVDDRWRHRGPGPPCKGFRRTLAMKRRLALQRRSKERPSCSRSLLERHDDAQNDLAVHRVQLGIRQPMDPTSTDSLRLERLELLPPSGAHRFRVVEREEFDAPLRKLLNLVGRPGVVDNRVEQGEIAVLESLRRSHGWSGTTAATESAAPRATWDPSGTLCIDSRCR